MSLRTGNARRVSIWTMLGLVAAATAAPAQEIRLPSTTFAPHFAQYPQVLSEQSRGSSWLRESSRLADVTQPRGVLVPLYVSYAGLQLLDAHSTNSALDNGASERNPMMRGMASRPAALLAVKAGVTVSTILIAERVRRKSRTGAIVLMAVLNSAFATVVAHNYAVAH